jgi:7,8-dihydropterin-6-yl-methyl-4-(beta-D-ribofuranosyl)aminobenzene 5'-phosphate synthase
MGRVVKRMKLTVLLDNNTLIDRYLRGEPGVSYFIEVEGAKVLFDVGYSDTFMENAGKLGIDLLDIDFLVLSHGHLDHTWGLGPLIRLRTEALLDRRTLKRPRLVAHPAVFSRRRYKDVPEIGSLLSAAKLERHFDLQLSREPVRLMERLVFLGEIERRNDYEAQESHGQIVEGSGEIPDALPDDTALAYESPGGLMIITGCSHSGICNIVEHARKVCGEERVADIIGGFHLLNANDRQLTGTVDYMRKVAPTALHACHCTDLRSKIELSRAAPLMAVGVGLALEV